MNPFLAALIVGFLLAVRFAVPCALVGGLCYWLDRTSQRWEEEARLGDV